MSLLWWGSLPAVRNQVRGAVVSFLGTHNPLTLRGRSTTLSSVPYSDRRRDGRVANAERPGIAAGPFLFEPALNGWLGSRMTHRGSLRVPCLVAPNWWVLDFLRGAASAPTLQLLLRNPVVEIARVQE